MGKYGFAVAIKPGQYNFVDIDNRHKDYRSTNQTGRSVVAMKVSDRKKWKKQVTEILCIFERY